MTDRLQFSQGFIGLLGSISSAGWILGALLYQRFLKDLSSKNLLNLSIAAGAVTTVAYLLLADAATAVVLNFATGFSAMLAMVATLTLAADFVPKRSEGFSFAVLMSLSNLAAVLADNVGSFLYDRVFRGDLTPLILVSAAFTALAFVLVPMLRLGDKRQGQPVAAKDGTAAKTAAG
jgi:predicted MFS family arabinose efflux permease